jgi:dual specificity phosphatase 12
LEKRIIGELQNNQMAETSISESETTTKTQLIYRCKKCRRIVASEENIVSHERGKGESSFKWNKRSSESWENGKQPVDCTSIFVEPMKWMQAGTCKFPSYTIISIMSPSYT